ncbi:unnamed protein product [Pieris macdunnoughi]|uniref:MADF domain-containing protein n=1 Tax=Pieris macdunnoughi TaxID=345717 RepID=A0A821R0Z2_9NEOP|nr:unnamed protein product [Pieris macdunnoughi]
MPPKSRVSVEDTVNVHLWNSINKIAPIVENKPNTLGLQPKVWTDVLALEFWKQYRLKCAFVFKKATIQEYGNYYLTIFGRCKAKTCKKKIFGYVEENPGDYGDVIIKINCRDTRFEKHEDCKRPLQGKRRDEMKKEVKEKGVKGSNLDAAQKLLQPGDTQCPVMSRANVLYQLKKESIEDNFDARPEDRKNLVNALLSINETPIYQSSVITVCLKPFWVFYATPSQIHCFREYYRLHRKCSRICIDATGGVVKKFTDPINGRTSAIFLYSIVINFDGTSLSVFQMLSEAHDADTITLWLRKWVREWKDLERILILTLIICNTEYEDSMICYNNKFITPLDARVELENLISNRKTKILIDDMEENIKTMDFSTDKSDILNDTCFESSCDNNVTIKLWADNLASHSDNIQNIGTILNCFYVPLFKEPLIHIAKEFPLWTKVCVPNKKLRPTSSYIEEDFKDLKIMLNKQITLPARIDIFVKAHLKNLLGGVVLLQNKITKLVDDNLNKSSISVENLNCHDKKSEEKLNNNDTFQDILQNENWRGLGNDPKHANKEWMNYQNDVNFPDQRDLDENIKDDMASEKKNISSMDISDNDILMKSINNDHDYDATANTPLSDKIYEDNTLDVALEKISRKITKEGAACKEKWQNMRVVFMRHLKPLPSGSRIKKKKPYYLLDYMHFLTPYVKPVNPHEAGNLPSTSSRENTTTDVSNDVPTEFEQCTERSNVDEPSPPSTHDDSAHHSSNPKRKKSSLHETDKHFINYLKQKSTRINESQTSTDSVMSFLKSRT